MLMVMPRTFDQETPSPVLATKRLAPMMRLWGVK